MNLVPHDGTSRFAATLLRTVRNGHGRDQVGFATVVGGLVQPDDWTARPFAANVAEHARLADGDRVIVAWLGQQPWVVARLSSERDEWWPVDQAQVTALEERLRALEARMRTIDQVERPITSE